MTARQNPRSPAVKLLAPARSGKWTLVWTDPATGRSRQQTLDLPANRRTKGEAEKQRIAKAETLAAASIELAAASTGTSSAITWATFADAFRDSVLSDLSARYASAFTTAERALRRLMAPATLDAVDADMLRDFAGKLRGEGKSQATADNYVRHILAGLSWAAKEMHWIAEPPAAPRKRRRGGRRRMMRDRPITGEEFDRLLAAVIASRRDDGVKWGELARGLWLSGLRLGEALALSWDEQAPFRPILGDRPMFRIMAEGQKGRRDEYVPMAPEFAAFLSTWTAARRRGRVFRTARGAANASRVFSAAGRAAGIVTSWSESGDPRKYASAHSLRRSFGTRWASRVTPAELMLLMRHRSVATTMEFYVALDAAALADKLGGAAGGAASDLESSHVVKEQA